jgi:hypothetical protein
VEAEVEEAVMNHMLSSTSSAPTGISHRWRFSVPLKRLPHRAKLGEKRLEGKENTWETGSAFGVTERRLAKRRITERQIIEGRITKG